MKRLKTNNSVAQRVKESLKNESRLDAVRDQVEEVTNRPVWNELSYKDGKLIGLLRTLGYEFSNRSKLLEITGIPEPLLEIFLEAYGHPTFPDKETGELIPEKPMQIQEVKEALEVAGEILGYQPYLKDITPEKVEKVYAYFRQRAEDTAILNKAS